MKVTAIREIKPISKVDL